MLGHAALLGWSFACARVAANAHASNQRAKPRQANSVVQSSVFLRRAYHASAVLKGTLYIDGGELSYHDNGNPVYQYSNTLISIDLTRDWTNSSVILHSAPKPPNAPSLKNEGIWVDRKGDRFYSGFSGVASSFGNSRGYPRGLWSFTPDGTGDGTWQSYNETANKASTQQPRLFLGQVASGNDSGFYLGGTSRPPVQHKTRDDRPSNGNPNHSSQAQPVSLISFDFETREERNTTVPGSLSDTIGLSGSLIYIANFGSRGILLSMGGATGSRQDQLIPFWNVRVYDVATQKWYEQQTTGEIPSPRKEFCMAGTPSSGRTYEILIYAGWRGKLGSDAISLDEAFVLTLPGFRWIQASYPALYPRHGLTCNAVGGGQILTIGGVDTSQNDSSDPYKSTFSTPDPFIQGLAVFSLSTLGWKDNYQSNPGPYTAAPAVQAYYRSNGRQPLTGFSSSKLETIFSIEDFASSDPDDTLPSDRYDYANRGAIVGGVVGGLAAACIIGLTVCLVRRRKRKQQERARERAPTPPWQRGVSADSIFREVNYSGNNRGVDTPGEMPGDDQGAATLRPVELGAEVPDVSPRSPAEKEIPRQASKASHVHDLGPWGEQAAELASLGAGEAHELESMSPTKPGQQQQVGDAGPEPATEKPEGGQKTDQDNREMGVAGSGLSGPKGEGAVQEVVGPKEEIERYELP